MCKSLIINDKYKKAQAMTRAAPVLCIASISVPAETSVLRLILAGRQCKQTRVQIIRGSMLRFFQALMPREEKFFALFDRHARILVEGALALRDLLEGGTGVPEACRRIVPPAEDAGALAR